MTINNIMLKGLFDSGMVDEATDLWELLEKDALCSPDMVTFGTLIHGLCENGFANKALKILEEAWTSGKELDVFSYSSMINGLCKDGRLDNAVKVYEMFMDGCNSNSHIYNALINGFCQASKISEAVRIYSEVANNGCSPTIYHIQHSNRWFVYG